MGLLNFTRFGSFLHACKKWGYPTTKEGEDKNEAFQQTPQENHDLKSSSSELLALMLFITGRQLCLVIIGPPTGSRRVVAVVHWEFPPEQLEQETSTI
jgi:hypothetical protein